MSLIDTMTRPVRHTRSGTSLRTRLDLWRSRRALARLDTAALHDIGVSEKAARKEARLTVWDVPASWKNL
ncbi:DUF1127 domain-containing protein [Roseobacter ponti]|uniref:DUF1127 domain-containing protein n=1 Tax=Roseobacter ponti TaxID=1891787 RepID=A0A858SR17_9RHOB|nr:DUF1127 domain-containing protein [Roseobacter ponti]QJF50447.1 DUF1127 domain-containing protein [Roseobacter ponti]